MTSSSSPVHDFTVRTAGVSVMDEEVFDALFEAGCDDALVGTDPDGDYLDFGRAAPTLEEAVASARAAIESVPGLRVLQVEPYGTRDETPADIARTA